MNAGAIGSTTLVDEIGTLIAVPPGPRRGAQMRAAPQVSAAAVFIENGRIAWFGPAADAPRAARAARRFSVGGAVVVPGLIDCHTHVPFAGSRSHEFVRRVGGESYLSIMQSGGGIRVTTAAVRDSTQEQLVAESLPRLRRMLALGITTVECKSGYGLSQDAERKQLRTIRQLAAAQPLELIPTYLGAHALPVEFDGRADEFIAHMSDEAYLASLAREGLARFADVFCDRGAFGLEESESYLRRCAAAGMKLKLHADELDQIGATRLAGALGAVSADHLEHIDDGGIAALKSGGVVPVVLPGTSFFLGIPHADARRMINADLPLALASDYNPGSCMIDSLHWILNIACCQLRMTPMEVLTACTANAAAALDLHSSHGAIAEGFVGDLTVIDAPDLDDWLYQVGRPRIRATIKRGAVVFDAAAPAA